MKPSLVSFQEPIYARATNPTTAPRPATLAHMVGADEAVSRWLIIASDSCWDARAEAVKP
jgi:hypothetical protein